MIPADRFEGVGQSQTSEKGLIKLLGVAKASFEELLADYEDILRQQRLEIYPRSSPKITKFRQFAFELRTSKSEITIF